MKHPFTKQDRKNHLLQKEGFAKQNETDRKEKLPHKKHPSQKKKYVHDNTPVRRKKLRAFRGILGPGLVTGASDDDPSGIATYMQAGARF